MLNRYIAKPFQQGLALYLSIEETDINNMENIIKKLEEMQEDIEKLISDNEEASQVWKMFDNLVDKLEDIHEEQEKTEERTYNGK